ncbi:MAG: hypothetical protein AAF292_16200 [Pseudomonadota bacterium]
MKRTSLITAVAGILSAGMVMAQSTDSVDDKGVEERPAILVEDPEQGEIEIFESQGAIESEIVSAEEMAAEAEVTAAMENEMAGDMAAMPEVAEDAEW